MSAPRCTPIPPASRRRFLQGGLTLGAGLVIGFPFGGRGRARANPLPGTPFVPNAFLRIAPDDTVTVISKHLEFGQGTYTGLATIVAEELDAAWEQVRVESAPADAKHYANLAFGAQGTGGSTAMANSWQQLREAGAMARAMLVQAAAEAWSVAPAEVSVRAGVLRAGDREASFGALAERAVTVGTPSTVTLKDPEDFRLIGSRLPRVDVPSKTDGAATFTLDLSAPEMLTAVVARSPRFGGTLARVDDRAARKVPGVVDVVRIPRGVAVLAHGFWAAEQGRRALDLDWDDSGAERRGTEQILAEYRALAATPGPVAHDHGDVDGALAKADRVLEAEYVFPYLAHAPMEPLDCYVELAGDRCRIRAGSQLQTLDQAVAASVLGMKPGQVEIETLLGGGSFGRRATPDADVVAEAASIAKAIDGRAPVKLVWTREDDLRGGRYRPFYVHRLEASLDARGAITAWRHRLVGQSIVKGTPFEAALTKDGIDHSSYEGTVLPYAVPGLRVEVHTTDVGVPVLWWRSVGHTHTAYSTETFLDEVAHATGEDPVALRLRLLPEGSRERGVLEVAAREAGWDRPLPRGWGRGVAVHASFQSYVAQVAEVSVGPDGLPRVHRVVCAVDCGIAINPDNVAAQMEGGIGFALGAAMHSEVELVDGVPAPSNFHDYPSLRIDEMPRVEVHVVPSGEAPTGVGEPGVPPLAPAVANAYRALMGEPIRRLPFRRELLRRA